MRQGSLGSWISWRAVALLALVHLVLPPAFLGRPAGCPMCPGVCHCASGGTGAGCSMRAASCWGGSPAHVAAAPDAARAILVARVSHAPNGDADELAPEITRTPSSPARPPLDHPPQISC